MGFIGRTYRLLVGIIMLIITILAIIIAIRYTKLESISIELCNNGKDCIMVDKDKYNESKVRKSLIFMSFRDIKEKTKIMCNYKVILNGENEICYDGNGNKALYKEKVDSVKVIKDKIKGNKITKVNYKTKVIKLSKDLKKILKGLN